MNRDEEPQPYPSMVRGGDSRPRTALGMLDSGRSALVVDADAPFRARTARLLESRGFEVRTAATYSMAILLVKVWMPDVIYAGIKHGSADFINQVRPYYEDPEPITDLRQQVDRL